MACLFCGGSLRYFFFGGSLGYFLLVLTIIYLLTIRSQGVSDLKVIEASPLPPSVFGCSIDQTKALEVFVKEVTLLGDGLVIHSLDELIIIRRIHHCEVAISHTSN